jgi:hypothetical protein
MFLFGPSANGLNSRSLDDADCRSQPKFETTIETIGNRAIHPATNLTLVVPDTEVPADNDLVFECIAPIDEVAQMHMAVLVDLVFLMLRCQKRHLGDEDFRSVHVGTGIQSRRSRISGIRHHGDADFLGHFGTGQPQVPYFVPLEMREFGLQFPASFPDDVA